MKPPCESCPDRYVGCHSVCDRYKEFQKFVEGRRKHNAGETAVTDYVMNTIRKSRVSHGKSTKRLMKED